MKPPTNKEHPRAYRKVLGHLRRQWEPGALVVYDDRITGAEVAEPFATLADPQLPERLGGKAGVGSAVSSGPGSSEGVLVGLGGTADLLGAIHGGHHAERSQN